MINFETKTFLLYAIYDIADEWSKKYNIACKKGCSSCCTQNVMITSLEASVLYPHIVGGEIDDITRLLEANKERYCSPKLTTNELANLCLEEKTTTSEEQIDSTLLNPCLFLGSEDECTIYEHRPLGCRCFLSLAPCHLHGTAKVQPEHVSFSTALMQLVEHIDANGIWGNMMYLIWTLKNNSRADNNNMEGDDNYYRETAALPGLLIPPDDQKKIIPHLNALFETKIENIPFSDYLKHIR